MLIGSTIASTDPCPLITFTRLFRILWGTASGETLSRLHLDDSDGRASVFDLYGGIRHGTPDGPQLFSGDADRIVRVWDTHTGAELLQLNAVGNRWIWSLDLSSDGRILAPADGEAVVTLWRME